MNTRSLLKLTLGLTLIVSLTGCASIVSGGSRKMTVNSQPTGATVTVTDKNGATVARETTPAAFELKRGAGYFKGASYTLKIAKDGYKPVEIPIAATFNGWYIGNLGFGGLIGFLIVDPLTGAMFDLQPNQIDQTLLAGQAAVWNDGNHDLVVLLKEQLTAEQFAQARPLVPTR